MRLHSDMRIQVIESPISFLATVPATLVHALDFFIAATRTLVLLGTGNWNERVYLRQRVRILCNKIRTRVHQGRKKTYLTRTRSSSSCSSTRRHGSSWRTVRSTRHAMWMVALWWPLPVALRRRVSLILRHIMTLRCVGRIRTGVGWAGCSNGGIYR